MSFKSKKKILTKDLQDHAAGVWAQADWWCYA